MQEVIAMSQTKMYRPSDHRVHIVEENFSPIFKSQLDIHFKNSILHIKFFFEKLKLDNSLA